MHDTEKLPCKLSTGGPSISAWFINVYVHLHSIVWMQFTVIRHMMSFTPDAHMTTPTEILFSLIRPTKITTAIHKMSSTISVLFPHKIPSVA